MISFDKEQERVLRESIEQLESAESVLGYYQLQGLLFAVACSPEPIKPAEWLDLIWLNDEAQFDNEAEADNFYKQLMALANHINHMTRQKNFLPFAETYSDQWQQELAEWCEGLLLGHQYLEDVWLIAADDLNDEQLYEEIDTTLSLASTFADLVGVRQLSFEDGLELAEDYLPEAYALFSHVLAGYASVGNLWSEGVWQFDAEQLFLSLEPVARDDYCPCGSGFLFGQCCLH